MAAQTIKQQSKQQNKNKNMSNKLKAITTKAKALYKTGRYKKWTDAIKAASKKTSKVSGVKKKAAPKKKAAKKTAVRNYGLHKDTHSHNVKISVMSGVGNEKQFRKLASKFLKNAGYTLLSKQVLKNDIPIYNVVQAVDLGLKETVSKVRNSNVSQALKNKAEFLNTNWQVFKKAYLK